MPDAGAGAERRRGAGRTHGLAGRAARPRSRSPMPGAAPALAPARRSPGGSTSAASPRGRHRLAAHVVLRADPGRGAAASAAVDGRAGGAGHGRRGVRRPTRTSPTAVDGRSPRAVAGVPSPMADLPGRRDVRLPGARRARARRPGGPRPARRAAAPRRRAAALVAGRRRPPTSSPTALVPVQHTPLGPLAGGLTLRDIPLRDRLRELDFEFPLAGGDRPARDLPDVQPGRPGRRCCAGTSPADDPMRAVRRPARVARRWASSRCAATSPGRSTWCCGCSTPADQRFVVVDYKTNWLGDPERAADRRRLPPGADGRGDAALALPAPGAAVLRRAAPLPALAAARLRPGGATSAACSTSTCAACAVPRPRWSTASRAGSSRGSRRRRWSIALSDLLDGVVTA